MLHCLLDTYTRNASGADGRKVPLSKDEPVMIMGEKQLSTSDVWNFYHNLCVPLRKGQNDDSPCLLLIVR